MAELDPQANEELQAFKDWADDLFGSVRLASPEYPLPGKAHLVPASDTPYSEVRSRHTCSDEDDATLTITTTSSGAGGRLHISA